MDEKTAIVPQVISSSIARINPAKTAEIVEARNEISQFIAKALTQGRDYGVIPGTKKPTLLKPGAELLCAASGLYPCYKVLLSENNHEYTYQAERTYWENNQRKRETVDVMGVYRFVIQCDLISRTSGQIQASGIGSASTLEKKYYDRPRDLENTVLKMAKKRALVDATLMAFALSDRFTQDVEDFADKEPEPARQSTPRGKPRGTYTPPKETQQQPEKRPYTDTPEDWAILEKVLKARDDIPEEVYPQIRTGMLGKYSTQLPAVLSEILAKELGA